MAMADAEDRGASAEDPGVALLAELQNTTGKPQVEMPEDDLNMDMEVSEPDAEPMGLMAKGA